MSKILIICNSFWPENNPRSFRATELAVEMANQSHEVHVWKPNVSLEQQRYAEEQGVKIKSIGDFKRKPPIQGNNKISKLLARIVNRWFQLYFEFPDIKLLFLVKKSIEKYKQHEYDFCISIAVPYPIHWGTAIGLRKNKIAKRWIADCGDPFMGDESDSFRHPFYFKFVEKYFCRKADFLTVPTKNSYKGYYEEFWDKIKVIPQGFNFEKVKLSDHRTTFECPTFGYAGGVIPNYREPFELLDYLVGFKGDFRFIVYSSKLKYFLPYKCKLGEKLILNEVSDRLDVLYEFSKLDFVVNFNNKGNKQTASKLIDYHIIKKPILNINFRQFSSEEFDKFYSGDYSSNFIIEDPDQYRIESVVRKFIYLGTNKVLV